jgi:tetratricopeptide (TPR) repeat protein
MAPEQARGEIDRVDERADVFGLGAILCEVLTGRPPYTGSTREEIRAQAARGDLAAARGRLDACGAEAELIALAKDCLAAEPGDRLRDAGEVARRMTAYLAGVQERLRAAELARVEAQTRAAEERKRRRVTVALAASVLVTASVIGGGWAYLSRQQLRRAAQLDLALREAEVLRDEAAGAGDDLARWLAARDAAHAAGRLLADARDAATRQRVTALVQQVTEAARAAEADQELLAKLVDIRSAEADDPDGSVSDAAYADAFREAGIDPDVLSTAEVGTKIKARPTSVTLGLTAALDDWAVHRRQALPKPEEAWKRLVVAARAADPDPRRDHLWELWAQHDRAAQLEPLRKLAQEANPETWPVPSLLLLAVAVHEAGDRDAGVALLRRAQARHPGDVWINYNLGLLLERVHPPRIEEAIRFYTAARALRPETSHDLAHALESRGQDAEALAIFRDLVRLRPDAGQHRACYGSALHRLARLDEAIAEFRAAIRLRPEYAAAHANLGIALHGQGKLDEAVAEYRAAIRLKPESADVHTNLGIALYDRGKLDEAVAEHRAAIRLKPNSANAHNSLGVALPAQGKQVEAIAEYRAAIHLEPEHADAHTNLGSALRLERLAEAITEFRAAIRLKPEHAVARAELGRALHGQGKLDEAVAEYRAAIRLKPESADVYTNLGVALYDQGKLDEAVVEHRAAIRLKPESAVAHSNLGVALRAQGKQAEAIAEYRAAIRLNPDDTEAHANLGLALEAQDKLDEATDEFRRAFSLARPGSRVAGDLPGLMQRLERKTALAKRLPAVLAGDDRPRDAGERMAFAQLSYDRARHDAAARLFAEAFQADPKLIGDMQAQNRYNAACAAALAGCGRGKDEPPLDEAGKARWRKQAIDWLKADLAFWTRQVEPGPPQARAAVAQTLQHWKTDPDLAGIRDETALARLPVDEQKACRSVWAEVDALLAKARGVTKP